MKTLMKKTKAELAEMLQLSLAELDDVQTDLVSATNEIAEKDARITELEAKVAELKGRISERCMWIGELEEDTRKKDAEIAILEAERDRSKSFGSKMKDTKDALRDDLEDLAHDTYSLLSHIARSGYLDGTRFVSDGRTVSRVGSLQWKIEKLRSKHFIDAGRYTEPEATAATFEETDDHLLAQIEAFLRNRHEARHRLNGALRTAAQVLRNEFPPSWDENLTADKIESKLSKTENDLRAAVAVRDTYRRKYREAEDDLAALKIQHDDEVEHLNDKIEKLQNELDHASVDYQHSQCATYDKARDLDVVQKDLATLCDRVTTLVSEIRSTEIIAAHSSFEEANEDGPGDLPAIMALVVEIAERHEIPVHYATIDRS